MEYTGGQRKGRGRVNGNYIVVERCMICDVAKYPGRTKQYDATTKHVICPECKRAVMYARELLKKKEQSGYFDRPEY